MYYFLLNKQLKGCNKSSAEAGILGLTGRFLILKLLQEENCIRFINKTDCW